MIKKIRNLVKTLFFRIFKKKLSKEEFSLIVETLARDPRGEGLLALQKISCI